jgi:hypothetical protein
VLLLVVGQRFDALHVGLLLDLLAARHEPHVVVRRIRKLGARISLNGTTHHTHTTHTSECRAVCEVCTVCAVCSEVRTWVLK